MFLKSASKLLIRNYTLVQRCKFSGQDLRIQQSCHKLRNLIKQQIKAQQQSYEQDKKEVQKLKSYFQKHKWKMLDNNNTLLQMTKDHRPYKVSVFFNAKRPVLISQNQNQKEITSADLRNIGQQQQEQQQIIGQTTVCVKKDGQEKYLIADYLISNQGSQLTNIQFVDDLKKYKKHRIQNYVDLSQDFRGPQLSSLEPKTQQLINNFMSNFGINFEFLEKISNFGIYSEQRFYIQWLKDLQSLT